MWKTEEKCINSGENPTKLANSRKKFPWSAAVRLHLTDGSTGRKEGLFLCHRIQLGGGQQKTAHPIHIARRRLELSRLTIDGLDRSQPPIRIDMLEDSGPGAPDHRLILRPVQHAVVDAPGKRVRKESGA